MKKIISILLVIVTVFSLSLSLASCGTTYGTGACDYATTRDITDREIYFVEMKVKGFDAMVILLDATTAPVTVDNFLTLVKSKFYDGLTMHRIIENFMIQGGDPKGNGSGGAEHDILGEFKLNGYDNDIEHIKGVISMARSQSYNSASSQFFICNADARQSLDGRYAAFGYVVEGLSVVDEITAAYWPKTDYVEYYYTYQQLWQYYGNGNISEKGDQPVIEYIKVLDNYKM